MNSKNVNLAQWCTIGQNLGHSFKIEHIDDTYTIGCHVVPRRGLMVTLRELATNKDVFFYMAGVYNSSAIDSHMCSLTDDLLDQWFKDRTKKTREDRDREKAEKKAKQAEEDAKPNPLAMLSAHIEKSIKKAKKAKYAAKP